MELYVFDKERKLTGMVESYEYLRWTRRYSVCGDFELHAIASRENLDALMMGRIIWKSDDEEAGFIEHIELKSDERESILVRGRFASSLLTRRIVWETENLRGDISEAVAQLVNQHLIKPKAASRKMSGVAFAAPRFDIPINTQVSYRNLLAAVEGLCETADVGYKTVWNRERRLFTFTLYQGAASQAVFAKKYENLISQMFVQSELDFCNAALIGGEGEGDERQLVTLGDASGEERRELFVDAKDLREASFGSDYKAALTHRGREKLTEHEKLVAFDAGINPHGNLKYKRDFDLGQLVRVSSAEWGVIVTTRITEIEESYDRDGQTLQIVFGRGLVTLGQRLKGGF